VLSTGKGDDDEQFCRRSDPAGIIIRRILASLFPPFRGAKGNGEKGMAA